MPKFLYRKSDIASVDAGKIGNDLDCLELKMNNVDDPDSRLFVILLDMFTLKMVMFIVKYFLAILSNMII